MKGTNWILGWLQPDRCDGEQRTPVGTDFLLEEMRHLSLQKEIWYQLWQMEVDSSLPVQQEMLYKALVASQSDGKRQRETLMSGEKVLVTGS